MPTYSTTKSREEERKILRELDHRYGWACTQTPEGTDWDGNLCRADGTQFGNAELKRRYHRFGKYPTVLLEKQKYDKIMARADHPGYFAVGWDDMIGWLRFEEHEIPSLPCELAGRTDRDDPYDLDLCYMVPIRWFTTFPRGTHAENAP